ncbi:Uncharacterised protein [Chlamydia abortus]|nr:Uncharacterised protein [Chlamydia abortus]
MYYRRNFVRSNASKPNQDHPRLDQRLNQRQKRSSLPAPPSKIRYFAVNPSQLHNVTGGLRSLFCPHLPGPASKPTSKAVSPSCPSFKKYVTLPCTPQLFHNVTDGLRWSPGKSPTIVTHAFEAYSKYFAECPNAKKGQPSITAVPRAHPAPDSL